MSENNIEDEFPREITLKAVYRNNSLNSDSIKSCMRAHNIEFSLADKASGKSTFTSYTISAIYSDELLLTNVCTALASLPGFMMMV